ncbi:hypothetical protein [Bradyrhizobium sp. 27S5]|uniref:HNH endonuclease n=1 Tax=Bradyrhizobium sp. 27S5 TaxID=3139728 RepID=UPI0030D2DFC0
MSKRFRGKPCVYCNAAPSTTTGDHVFAREFFLESRRANLPKVPACDACNNDKSKLEHYLTAVLPFGGRHNDSAEHLSTLVEPRLANNLRLHGELSGGLDQTLSVERGVLMPVHNVPIDGEKIGQLFSFIAKALLWHHWQTTMNPESHGIWAGFLNPIGLQLFSPFFASNNQVRENLGEGTFVYEGVRGTDDPEMSLWLFSIYGGMKLSGDPSTPTQECSTIGAITATHGFMTKFATLLGGHHTEP